MRHRPAEPAPSARSAARHRADRTHHARPGRRRAVRRLFLAAPILLAGLVVAVVTGMVPGVAGAVSKIGSAVSLAADTTSARTGGDAGIVMGVDGAPASGRRAAADRPAAGATSVQSGSVLPEDDPSGTALGDPGAAPSSDLSPVAAASSAGTPPADVVPGAAGAPTEQPPATEAGATTPAPAAAPSPSGTPSPSDAPVPSASATPSPAAATTPAERVVELVNEQRARAGCAALSISAGLTSLAQEHSEDMRDRDYFSHTDPDGLDPFERGARAGVPVLAENIAEGQPDAAAVMAAWMSSAGHRANILNCGYRTIGVGFAAGQGGPWWTQEFA